MFFLVRFRNVVDRENNRCWWSSESFRIVSSQPPPSIYLFVVVHVNPRYHYFRRRLSSFKSVNTVVPGSKVLSTAISLAQQITSNSPDAVQSSKVALLLSQKHNFSETFTTHNLSPENRRVYKGANIKVGLFLYVVYWPGWRIMPSRC